MRSADAASALQRFDAVVMLTWSDWKTEPRANRYHYATRFASHLPVLFVQPDAKGEATAFEETEIGRLTILHVPRTYGPAQTAALSRALRERRIVRPLLWMYNVRFADFARQCFSALKVYHATEDYFSPYFDQSAHVEIRHQLRHLLRHVDLVVAVSDGVARSYQTAGGYTGEMLVLPNGCDFAFWQSTSTVPADAPRDRPVACFQGGINHRLDASLMHGLLDLMPDWEFWFCGKVDPDFADWPDLKRRPNVRYLGMLAPAELRDVLHSCTVGIMPFVQTDIIVAKSLPLKAFEYAACGLPVVTVPIRALESFPHVFRFATDPSTFAAALRAARQARRNPDELAMRLKAAASQDYDLRFADLMAHIARGCERRANVPGGVLNILILYDPGSTHVATISDHLESFWRFSRHRVLYAAATRGARLPVPPALFDVVVVHYSVRVSLPDHLSAGAASALRECPSFKVLFIQDEYDSPEVARGWIERLGIHAVFSCVPERHIHDVYPADRFPRISFVPTLTGYVPAQLETLGIQRPLAERPLLIGYRGRDLPYWYGNLGREKSEIGERMNEICQQRGLPVDIEWTSDKRIYGTKWFEFLASCKATLGTESGSNVFDDAGEIQSQIREALARNPTLSYAEAFEKYLKPHEGRILMNQISPKIFEAIALRTALVLFEGNYSGIIKPYEHYIPLRKDFGNVDEVLNLVQDDGFLRELTGRAYDDLIASGRYSYRAFIAEFDRLIESEVRKSNGASLLSSVRAYQTRSEGTWTCVPPSDPTVADLPLGSDVGSVTRACSDSTGRQGVWASVRNAKSKISVSIRRRLRPFLRTLRTGVRSRRPFREKG